MRGDFPKPGQRCWANFCGSYGLPSGLAHRDPLTFLGRQDVSFRFRGDNGAEWLLNFAQFVGTSFQYLDGDYCAESHPRFAEWIRHLLTHLDPHETPGGHAMETAVSGYRWMLERNGFDPDQPPQGPCPKVTPGPVVNLPNPRLPVREERAPRRMRS